MDNSALAPWRDLSIVWFVLWTFIFMLIPGAAFYFAVRGVRWLKRQTRQGLLHAHIWMLRIQQETARATNALGEAPIRIHSNATRWRVTARGVLNYLRGEE